MLSAEFMDLLDEVACIMKKRSKSAFGGVLIFLVVDLAQLAPVPDLKADDDPEGPKWKKIRAQHAFDSRRVVCGRGLSFSVAGSRIFGGMISMAVWGSFCRHFRWRPC